MNVNCKVFHFKVAYCQFSWIKTDLTHLYLITGFYVCVVQWIMNIFLFHTWQNYLLWMWNCSSVSHSFRICSVRNEMCIIVRDVCHMMAFRMLLHRKQSFLIQLSISEGNQKQDKLSRRFTLLILTCLSELKWKNNPLNPDVKFWSDEHHFLYHLYIVFICRFSYAMPHWSRNALIKSPWRRVITF